ncbi:MAG: hypothetical protein RLZ98_2674 [Pseudomonadota bacterium]|jgi:hypothetical protein
MGKMLTGEQVERFRDEGWVSPVRVMTEAEAGEIRRDIEDFELRQGRPLNGPQKTKCALLFPSIYRMVSRR